MDLNAAIFKKDRNYPAWKHTSTKAVATVRIRRVWVVGCGQPEPQEEAAMAEGVENLAGHDGIFDGCQNSHPRAAARTLQDSDREGTVFILHLPQWN